MTSRKGILRKGSSESSFLHRQFSALSLAIRQTDEESADEVRGPYGLTVLHEPAEPLIDFVFVHGLRGGSRKTWSKTSNPAHFWPKVWLPLEPQFKNVRILTFGYNSDWGDNKRNSIRMHDYAQALLAELRNSMLAGGLYSDTPIVFVAHSMGGIVIKKVLMMAKQDPNFHKVAARIHSMFFLATPHHSSDSASMLRNFLQLSGRRGTNIYVDDLTPASQSMDLINEEFRHFYQDIKLWSFFETVKTPIGVLVERRSAVLGFAGEQAQLLNADHRNICKFDDPADSNYCILRTAFAAAISTIKNTWYSTRPEEYQADMRKLSDFLGYLERPDADFLTLSYQQIEGSCEWLTDKQTFFDWREGLKDIPNVFWLRGDPATGKSTAMAHVIKYLRDSNADCSFFFFKHGIKGKSTAAELLCSLAWQMAASNTVIRRKLLSMQKDGITIDLADPATIWRTIFLSPILQTELPQPHYWIIDALDESADASTICQFLSKFDKGVRLRVCISSRPNLTMERVFAQEKFAVTVENTSLETSLEDIKMYLNIHAEHFPVGSDGERQKLVTQILEKSNGNFLWSSLVVKELEDSYSQESIERILQSVPKGIDDLYARIVRTITTQNSNAVIAKAILRWVVCAARPLTVDELRDALALDIKQTVPQLEQTAGAICGYLVFVDSAGRVHAKHQTVKDYLFRTASTSDSDLAFDRVQEHGRVAEICLNFLCSDVMKTVRYRRTNMSVRKPQRPSFTDYAISHFSRHISRATASDDRHLITLNKFLLTNSLTWIELIAAKRDLSPLTEAAKNFKSFMERRVKYRSPLGKEVQNVLEWADDLIRLVAQFGQALISTPSAIHFLIPPVCPSGSIISRNFSKYPNPIKLVGLSQSWWDDRLCCIACPQLRASCIACNVNKFAIGMSNGHIHVYHERTFDRVFSLDHGETRILCLAFTHSQGLLAAAGPRKVTVWDLSTGSNIWTASLKDIPLALEFTEDDSALMAGTRGNKLIFWETTMGKEMRPVSPFSDFDEDKGVPFGQNQPPIHAAFSPGLGLLGVAYRLRPISFYETENCTFAGQYHRTGSSRHEAFVHDFIFNPVPEICLAAVSFQNGDLCVFDPWSQNTQAMVHCDSSCLASSPNGTILASGDGNGVIKLFDFESLRLLYQINSHQANVKSICFSTNGLRFYDIRQDHCNAWEPSVLVRSVGLNDDSSVDPSERATDEPHFTTARASDADQEIKALASHDDGKFLFCGLASGTVKLYSTANGKHLHGIVDHPGRMPIIFLDWNQQKSLLSSVDEGGLILIHQLNRSDQGQEQFTVHCKILECTSPSGVQQLLVDAPGKHMLFRNREQTALWDLEQGKVICELPNTDTHCLVWNAHPLYPDALLLTRHGMEMQIYQWKSLESLHGPKGLIADIPVPQNVEAQWVVTSSCQNICTFVGDGNPGSASSAFSALCLYPFELLWNENDSLVPTTSYMELAKTIKMVIGHYKTLLLFLNHDGWVCSLKIDDIEAKTYTKHFYIPQQWQNSGASLQMLVTTKGSVVLVCSDELAVFHNGLSFEEHVQIPSTDSLNTASPKLHERPALEKQISSPT